MQDLTSFIVEQYHDSEKHLNGLSESAVHQRRRSAFDLFRTMEFPTLRHEEWKHTNIKALLGSDYRLSDAVSAIDLPMVEDFVANEDDTILVFLNGHFSAARSRVRHSSIVVGGLHELYATHQQIIDKHIATLALPSMNAFVAANTSCMSDGAFIYVPDSTIVDASIYIVNIVDARSNSALVQPRNLFVVGAGSQANVIMRTVTNGSLLSVCNQVTEIVVGENANIHVTLVQDDVSTSSQIHSMQCLQRRASVCTIVTVSLSGQILRNDVGTRLSESGAEAHMYGLYCVNGSTVVDNHTVMDHMVAHCHSNELYKGVLDGTSQGVFNGKIFVREDAQKTLAYQSNRNVLLSNTATVNTKPQLEIFADDVKCSHGCTVGKMDEEALFYLRARGISEVNARALLLTAFAEDVTTNIRHEGLRNFVNAQVEHRLTSTHE